MSLHQHPKGKIVGFNQIKQGKALLQLKDGNYVEVVLVIHKIIKSENPAPNGNPLYFVNTGVNIAVWTQEEIAQLEE